MILRNLSSSYISYNFIILVLLSILDTFISITLYQLMTTIASNPTVLEELNTVARD